MADYITDLIEKAGNDVIHDILLGEINGTLNKFIEEGLQGNITFDFEDVQMAVCKTVGKTILNILYEDVVRVDFDAAEQNFAEILYKYIGGEALNSDKAFESMDFDRVARGREEVFFTVKNVFNLLDVGKKSLEIKNICDELKNAKDSHYFRLMERLSNAFTDLAKSASSFVPGIGYAIRTTISAVKGAFENQYGYIINDMTSNNSYYARLVISDELKEAALYLLAQENLIFDEEAVITMMLDKKIKEDKDGFCIAKLAYGALYYEDHNELLNFYLNEIIGFADIHDAVRDYCRDLLVDNGFTSMKYMTFEQIQENLSILNGNIAGDSDENGGGGKNHGNGSSNFDYSFVTPQTFNSVVKADTVKADKSTARYDPLVIDMGRTGLKFYNYTSFCK